jgi:hypothetical protein
MPKVLADYSNTIIYKLCCNNPSITDIYIGHTTNFIQRKNRHKNCCYNVDCNSYVYTFIRDHDGWDNWAMIQIENCSCKNKREAESIEHYWITTLSSTLNSNKPYAMCKEEPQLYKQHWYEENKETILEKAKEHYEENKEQKLEYQKQYAEDNKEKISEYQKQYTEDNKEKISAQKKTYCEEHKGEIKIAMKKWQEENKDKIKQQKSQIMNCECGHQYTFGNKHRHLQSTVHNLYYDNLTKPKLSIEEQKTIDEANILLEEENKNKLKEQQKIYRETNAEQIQNSKKQHYKTHKDKILKTQKKYKEEHKEQILEQDKKYVEENKDKIKEKKNEWYLKNKEAILKKQKEIIICECGSQIRQAGKNEHCRSKKHQDYLLSL